ncbi:dihydropteroate synthase [Tannerella sp.]|uniref:dihydropteroate synthase n=1 Tax=Tannerella sp. TaxID=2382127 RepID=UPI0026DDC515|nr:dihydropteroate synthase [Tannerella sp.]MDO4703774.1 dihydropteroate synthase [Tannerella sp.]
MKEKSINLNGRLLSLKSPVVMGILNTTPDSFYAGSRQANEVAVAQRIETILAEGGTIVDIGGYSSRPDAADVTEADEWQRIEPALKRMQKDYPDIPVSVDTFRATIARRAVEEYGIAMVNDISGGMIDAQMFETVASLQVPYVLMHMRGTPQTMQQHTDYDDLMEEIMLYFAQKVRTLRQLGVNDVILDPGFGFAKTLEQNYELMRSLPEFSLHFEAPLLVGVSRKSMIYKLLGTSPEDSLNGTTVLNTYALLNGADILRVHDVKAAAEAIKIVKQLTQS